MQHTPATKAALHDHPLLKDVSQAQIDRLIFIDFRLYFLGELSRADLMDRFSIGGAGATRDIALYKQCAPTGLELEGATKVYRPTRAFQPLFEHSITRALTALSQGYGEVAANKIEPLVRSDYPFLISRPNIEVLALISRAIHRQLALRVAYSSNTSGAGRREIVPFALVNNGVRWHVRAFDRKSSSFRDFVLTRVSHAELLEASHAQSNERPENDAQWSRIIELELMIHPSVERPEVIAQDYDLVDGVLRVKVRATNAGYLLGLWNVDCSPDRSLKGKEYVLCLRDPLVLHAAESALMAPGFVDLRPQKSQQ
jgi:predicted DNA-binding transcriptional regulator YafY